MNAQALKSDDPFDLDDVTDLEQSEGDTQFAILTFRIGPQIFGVDVRFVREILDLPPISALPNAPHGVLGMTDVRGQGVAIIDLAYKLGTRLENAETARAIVFEFTKAERQVSVCVIADEVRRVREISKTEIESVPETLSDWQCDTTTGTIRIDDDGIAMLLDIQNILGAKSLDPFEFPAQDTLSA